MSLSSLSPSRSHTHTLVSASTTACLKCLGCPSQKARCSRLQQHCIWRGTVKREGTTFSIVTSSSSTYPRSWKFGSIPFLCLRRSETLICHHLFLHDLFIETTATFSHKRLEKVKICIPIYSMCETKKKIPCPVNCQDSARKYEFHVSLEELDSIQVP